jgi:DNA repair protein RecO (recombination protein O)
LAETTVTAVVLRRSDAGESDRRLVLFTRELGKVEAVAKGARKGGSRLAGVSEPLTVARFHLARTRVRRFVTQAQPVSSLPKVRADYDRLLCGLAIAEIVDAFMPYEAVHEDHFDSLLQALAALGGEGDPAVPLVWFASRLLSQEGQMPDWGVCALSRRPITGERVWFSVAAGGAVLPAEADRYGDRRSAHREALVGLARTAELPHPPEKLKRSTECCAVLFRLWQGVLDAPLPAWESVVRNFGGNGE